MYCRVFLRGFWCRLYLDSLSDGTISEMWVYKLKQLKEITEELNFDERELEIFEELRKEAWKEIKKEYGLF